MPQVRASLRTDHRHGRTLLTLRAGSAHASKVVRFELPFPPVHAAAARVLQHPDGFLTVAVPWGSASAEPEQTPQQVQAEAAPSPPTKAVEADHEVMGTDEPKLSAEDSLEALEEKFGFVLVDEKRGNPSAAGAAVRPASAAPPHEECPEDESCDEMTESEEPAEEVFEELLPRREAQASGMTT